MTWVKDISSLSESPPLKYDTWMKKPKNLGDALRLVCNVLTLNVIEQTFGLPLEDELDSLNLNKPNDEFCYQRKIFLIGDGIPFTYGRVVVPKRTYLSHMDKFNSLGGKLIGETLLYSNPKTIRSSFEFNKIDRTHPLYISIVSALPISSIIPEALWARRSIFSIGENERLLITEAFLEEIPLFKE